MTADDRQDPPAGGFIATLNAMRTDISTKKEAFEQVVGHLDAMPAPDPDELLDQRPRIKSMSALYTLSQVMHTRVTNDIEVFDTGIQMLDRAIEMAEAGREQDARDLMGAFPDLMRQLAPPPRPRT